MSINFRAMNMKLKIVGNRLMGLGVLDVAQEWKLVWEISISCPDARGSIWGKIEKKKGFGYGQPPIDVLAKIPPVWIVIFANKFQYPYGLLLDEASPTCEYAVNIREVLPVGVIDLVIAELAAYEMMQ